MRRGAIERYSLSKNAGGKYASKLWGHATRGAGVGIDLKRGSGHVHQRLCTTKHSTIRNRPCQCQPIVLKVFWPRRAAVSKRQDQDASRPRVLGAISFLVARTGGGPWRDKLSAALTTVDVRWTAVVDKAPEPENLGVGHCTSLSTDIARQVVVETRTASVGLVTA
jgi:hypothetical protein